MKREPQRWKEAKAPKKYDHGDFTVEVKRHLELPEFPSMTAWAASRITVPWKPDIVICHTLWPVAYAAKSIANKYKVPWIAIVHGHDFDVALSDHRSKRIEALAKSSDKLVVVSNSLSRFDSVTIMSLMSMKNGITLSRSSEDCLENPRSISYSQQIPGDQRKTISWPCALEKN